MTKKIYLVTTNKRKLEIAQAIFFQYGIELENIVYETPEIQSFDTKEIAEFSAKYAANKLNKSVVTTDVGYYIKSLNGFPGPYAKQFNNWFSAEQVIELMKGKKNRDFEMKITLAYCQPGYEPVSFHSLTKGVIAEKAEGEGYPLDRIMIREGHNKVQALYSDEEILHYFKQHLEHYHKFCEYYNKLGSRIIE